jgi:hypothetical protein
MKYRKIFVGEVSGRIELDISGNRRWGEGFVIRIQIV